MQVKKMSSARKKDQYDSKRRDSQQNKAKASHPTEKSHPEQSSTPYEDRSRDKLYQVAKELNIEGRSKMDKDELIKAIRKH